MKYYICFVKKCFVKCQAIHNTIIIGVYASVIDYWVNMCTQNSDKLFLPS